MDARRLLESNLALVRRVIDFVARRKGLRHENRDDFESFVMVRLLDNDGARLRKFQGRSNLKTYLSAVIHRLAIDFHIQRFGKWRPSTKAKRMGVLAVALEKLLSRDGYGLEEAIEILTTNQRVGLSRDDLSQLAAHLPIHPPRRLEGAEALEAMAATETADGPVIDCERNALARQAASAIEDALISFSAEDRLILEMRYRESLTVARIATTLGLDQRALYSRIDQCLRRLQRHLEESGFDEHHVAEVLAATDTSTEIRLHEDDDGT